MFLLVMRRSIRFLTAALALLVLSALQNTTEVAAAQSNDTETAVALGSVRDTPAEQVLFDALNTTRAEHGLAPLQRDPALDQIAIEWTTEMSPSGSLSHRGDLRQQVESRVTSEWMRIGENVGWGPSAEWLHGAFFDSAPHRANMLGDYNRVGIGALLEDDGYVWVTVNFLDGPDLPNPIQPSPNPIEGLSADAWAVSPDGVVTPVGDSPFLDDPSGLPLQQPVVGIASTPTGDGYWLVASDGGIFAYGDARFHGSTGAIALNQPIVGMAPTATGDGYWLVASDGGIFAFGDARFHGSTGAITLNQPIVGMAPTATGDGYWLVASDGGIFAFGDARFHGSTGALSLAAPIVSMASTPSGNGYWLVASDGGVFTFGDGGFAGSASGSGGSVVGMTPADTGSGLDYWIYLSDGRALGFGDDATASSPVLDSTASITGVAVRRG
ncbi:MAG: CAP domain-containing protein [Actinomycetia bacterium]|nr:CAP domain-containing protein [Actinomycetes bacterium]